MLQGIPVWAGLLFGGVSQVRDTRGLRQGDLNRKQYAVETTENATGAVGVWAGVEYGSLLGSALLPVVGTVAGAVLGGVLGAKAGTSVGHSAGTAVFNQKSATVQKLSDIAEPVVKETKTTFRKFAVKSVKIGLSLSDKAKETAADMKRQLQAIAEEARNRRAMP